MLKCNQNLSHAKSPAPWMTFEIIKPKRRHRYLERVWRNHAHLWTGHATQDSVITAPD